MLVNPYQGHGDQIDIQDHHGGGQGARDTRLPRRGPEPGHPSERGKQDRIPRHDQGKKNWTGIWHLIDRLADWQNSITGLHNTYTYIRLFLS